jgi:hypothetical protein
MAEWLKAAVLKTVSGVTRSGVRIPLPPPSFQSVTFGWSLLKMAWQLWPVDEMCMSSIRWTFWNVRSVPPSAIATLPEILWTSNRAGRQEAF